ncbi:hypothetical protein B0T09DRAFT_287981 [Sordaria sp. MPI-SDFR-AT-0083]|nr:hypothetical protein B0T09DRAFT_287981 [Sordaria sp. MPI-SDFR-AT-0083]
MLFPILLSLVSAVAAQHISNTQSEVATGSACSQIAHSYESWSKNGGHGDFTNIPGQTAYGCLMSMPFDSERAVQFLDEYLKYLQFQSTLDSLKHPTPGYITPSIDLLKGFSKIRKKAETSIYKSQYEFDNDVKTLIHRANEGHLEIHLCSHQVFRFHRSPPLVSLSSDGLELPEIYTWNDARLLHSGFPSVSHLTEINGVDATYFLQAHLGITFEYHDPDTRLKFSNGTTLNVSTAAIWPGTNGPMNYTDGETLLKAACIPGYEPSLMTFSDPNVLPPPRHIDGQGPPPSKEGVYPDPRVRDERDAIRGYYLDTLENDTAVLQISTFQHTGGIMFSQTTLDFLTRASRDDNKTKLILDLSGNNGGDVIPGFNMFKILFPDLPVRTATRFRATELVKLVGKVYSEVHKDVEERKEVPIDPPFVASVAVGPGQERVFGQWEELFGPEMAEGSGNMSNLLAHFDLDLASTTTDPIYGYGAFTFMTKDRRPFKAEDIAVITNGQCASTCALLISLLRRQAGVRTLVFGGRPRYAPMQAVGGVKGGQYWSLGTVYRHVSKAIELATNATLAGRPVLTDEELETLKELGPVDPNPGAAGDGGFPLRMGWRGEGGVNFRDLYYLDEGEGEDVGDEAENANEKGDEARETKHSHERKKKEEGEGEGEGASKGTVPAQFIYEPAECRRFFTVEMMFRPAKMWEVAREVMFGDGECVKGSETGDGSGNAEGRKPKR